MFRFIASFLILFLLGSPVFAGARKPPKTDRFAAFRADKLEKALLKIRRELGEDRNGRASAYALMADTLGPFWTAPAMGAQAACSELGVSSALVGPAEGMSQKIQSEYIALMLKDNFGGLAISGSDGKNLRSAFPKNGRGDKVLIAIDNNILADIRQMYIGTDNYRAGRAAGTAMIQALGKTGGNIVLQTGNTVADNATERIRGIKDQLNGSNVHIVEIYEDNDGRPRAEANTRKALKEHPDIKGFIGIFSYDGPAILTVLRDAKLTKNFKVVAFDLYGETRNGLKEGIVAATIGQRSYYWGKLSIYVMHSLRILGEERTRELLRDELEGPNKDILDTGFDVVTPENVDAFNEYTRSLGISY